MRTLVLLLTASFLCACETPKVSKEELDGVNFGPEPVRWKEEVMAYLKLRLRDPANATVDFKTRPKMMFQKQVGFEPQQHGWALCVAVRDKDRQGVLADKPYPMTVFIRNEQIVAVNNGPDSFGPLESTYARRQCKDLGAPFD